MNISMQTIIKKMSQTTDQIKVTIHDGLTSVSIKAKLGELLLDVLRRSGKPITSPCGGKGTCKKCCVDIKGVGAVLACLYRLERNIEVHLPGYQYTIMEQSKHYGQLFNENSGIETFITNESLIVKYKDDVIIEEKSRADDLDKFGIAIDVGTTTVVLFLQDLTSFEILDVASFVNPQSAYGGDVISRITYCMEHESGLSTLRRILIEKINMVIEELCQRNSMSPQRIYKTTLVGNSIMLHILAGVDPRSIAFAPYTPVFVEEKQLSAGDLNLKAHPNSIVKLLPSIAGYVGADIVAGLATTDVLQHSGYTLYIDIGTNGEIVLGNENKLYCCATAAGPALEGANITHGIGGVTGAICAYEDDEYSTIGGTAPIGICGSGLIDIIAALLDKKYIDVSGYLAEDFMVVPQKESAGNRNIVITPNDVRQVQLAKSAIYAGILTLMKIADISFEQIDRLYIAGGFGNYIRVESAVRIGLIPRALEGRVMPIGNSAGTGAVFALKSLQFETQIQTVLDKTEYIELSTRQDFNEKYVASMMFA